MAIQVKKASLDRLEAELESTKLYINEGFATIMSFLTQSCIDRPLFWETAFQVMILQLEKQKREYIDSVMGMKEEQARLSDLNKMHLESKRLQNILEEENKGLRAQLLEKDIYDQYEGNRDSNPISRFNTIGGQSTTAKSQVGFPREKDNPNLKLRERATSGMRKFEMEYAKDSNKLRTDNLNLEVLVKEQSKVYQGLRAAASTTQREGNEVANRSTSVYGPASTGTPSTGTSG